MTLPIPSEEKKYRYAANGLYAIAAGYVGYRFLTPKEPSLEKIQGFAVESCKHKLTSPWYGHLLGQRDAKQKAMTAFEKCVGDRVEEKIHSEQSHLLSVDIGITATTLGLAIVFSSISDMYRKHSQKVASDKSIAGPQPF